MRIINNITKLALGGIPPYVSYVPNATPSATYSPMQDIGIQTLAQNTATPQLLTKELEKFLYENGIPVDVDVFLENSRAFSSGLFNGTIGVLLAGIDIKNILRYFPRLKAENDRLLLAIKLVEDNQGLGEIAVTSNGYVFVENEKGEISKRYIELVDFSKDRVLTNSDLIDMRLNDPRSAFKTEISNVIGNGVGMPKILEYIKLVIDKLGAYVYGREGYVNKESLDAMLGFKQLGSLDSIFSVSQQTKTQTKLAEAAINYLLTSLPKNMLTVLQANAALRLLDNSRNGVKTILTLLASSVLNHEDIQKINYEDTLTTRSSGASKSNKGTDLKAPETLLLGMGDAQSYPINVGTSDYMYVKGYSSMLTDKDGNSLGKGTLQDVMNGQFGSILDWNNISMGGEMINTVQTNKIALDGNRIVAADLPVDMTALRRGIIKPDIDMLRRKEEADTYIRDNNITDIEEINKIYQSPRFNLPIMYTEDGKLNTVNYRRFGIISGFADAKAFSDLSEDLDNNPLLLEITDDNLYESVVQTLTKADKDFSSSDEWLGGTNTYEGQIYIPLVENFVNTSLGSKNYLPLPEISADLAYQLEELKKKRLEYKKPLSLSNYEGK